jgi:hypothetical protein
MGERVVDWSTAHPDPSPGSQAAVRRLQELVVRANQVASQQRDGTLEVRRATARKRELRHEIKEAHLDHIVSVAELASRDEPELAEKFRLPGRASTYSAFRTAARGILAETESRKELLVEHGLSEAVVDGLRQRLDELDAVIEQGSRGRAAHVGASAEQDNLATEIMQNVNVLDGLNRFRFGKDEELLSAWQSISSVVATPKRGAKPESSSESPAA